MIEDIHPVLQALLGTLMTWGLTAAGSAAIFVLRKGQRKILDASLGFAAGVMTAASFWSLIAPGIEMAEQSGYYGKDGEWAFVPVAIGFFLGALFVFGADKFLPWLGVHEGTDPITLTVHKPTHDGKEIDDIRTDQSAIDLSAEEEEAGYIGVRPVSGDSSSNSQMPRRRPAAVANQANDNNISISQPLNENTAQKVESPTDQKSVSWRRMILLIVAITVHNIPEGLAVGVAFGAIGKSESATFESARNLAIGIGIQNFPEGLAVSMPLRSSGMGVFKSFMYGQLSGMVEPIAGVLGAALVVVAQPLLPYALAFAAGAMIFVVVDDIIPEANTCGNGTICSWGAVAGFLVMMSLDVGLG